MLKIKYEDLDNYNLSELKEIIKQLNEDKEEMEMIYRDNDIRVLEKRIDKAVEYIINHSEEYKPHFRKIELGTEKCNELLNILKGDNDE